MKYCFREVAEEKKPALKQEEISPEQKNVVLRYERKAEVARSLVVPEPDAAGYLGDSDRFDRIGASDEEFMRRRAKLDRHEHQIAHKRVVNAEREEARWENISRQKEAEESRWRKLRENGEKAKKNLSSVPYNAISLTYKDDIHGEELRHQDAQVKYRAAVRSRNLKLNADSRSGYNIITGAGQPSPDMPDKPEPPPALAHHIDAVNAAAASQRAIEFNNMVKRRVRKEEPF